MVAAHESRRHRLESGGAAGNRGPQRALDQGRFLLDVEAGEEKGQDVAVAALVVDAHLDRRPRRFPPDAGHFDVIAPVTPTWTIVLQAVREVFARLTH